MKINLVYNKHIDDYKTSLEIVEDILIKNKVDFNSFDLSTMGAYGDFSIVIGGDGTLINAAKFYSKFSIPVFGINIGRLGFLSQSKVNEFEFALNKILTDNFEIEERIMLEAFDYKALIDFVIKGCNPSRTSKFYLEINGNPLCDYIADGLIVSTPTG